VQHLMRELNPDQLEQVAISLAAAAREARDSQTQNVEAARPAENVEEARPNATQAMDTAEPAEEAAAAETAALAASQAVHQPPGAFLPAQPPLGTPGSACYPSGPPLAAGNGAGGLGDDGNTPFAPLEQIAETSPASPLFGGPAENGSSERREGSRSPRRETPKPESTEEVVDLEASDKKSSAPGTPSKVGAKTARIGVSDDAGAARTRSQSATSAASASAAGLEASHYAAIANDLGAEFAKAKALTPGPARASGDSSP